VGDRDRVRRVSPASFPEESVIIDDLVRLLGSWGLEVEVGEHVLDRHGYRPQGQLVDVVGLSTPCWLRSGDGGGERCPCLRSEDEGWAGGVLGVANSGTPAVEERDFDAFLSGCTAAALEPHCTG